MQLMLALLLTCSLDLEIEAARVEVTICESNVEIAEIDREIAVEHTVQRLSEWNRARKATIAYSPQEVDELEHIWRLAVLDEKKAIVEIKRKKADLEASKIRLRILEAKLKPME